MNGMFSVNGVSPANGAPKRSNSGREIVYFQNQRVIGSNQPMHDVFVSPPPPPQTIGNSIPEEVQNVFDTVLRKYTFRDLYRWLKQDRQHEIDRSSMIAHAAADHMPHGPRPSIASSNRTSRTSSVFSMPQYDRRSFASSRTSYSMVSDPGMETLSPPGQIQGAQVVPINQQTAKMVTTPPSARTSRNNSIASSRTNLRQRESELEGKKRYFCTACNKGFARKYDWKVHEQRYHEQQSQYPCPDCNQIMYAETHFRSHHRDAHGCQQCNHGKEVSREVDPRRRRTAWGCGFCGQLLDDWEKRCDHISAHYDEGCKRTEWDHSKVIIGLLRQPEIDPAWQSLLIERHGHCPSPPLSFRWSKEATSRSHGDNLQLQDWLELGAITRDVQYIVQLAYDQGRRPDAEGSPASPESNSQTTTTSTTITAPDAAPEGESNLESSEPPPPQDSAMASPTIGSSEPPPTTSFAFLPTNAVLAPFTGHPTPPQQHDPNPHDHRRASLPGSTIDPSWDGFASPGNIFHGTFMNHSMPSFIDKALPPTPVEQSDVNMLPPPSQHSQSSVDSGQPHFGDSWSMFDGASLHSEQNGIMPTVFETGSQF